MEEWRVVPSFPDLEASSEGRVRRIGREPLKTPPSAHGYPLVNTRLRGKKITVLVRRLVCEAFHGPANGRQVDHLNAVRSDEWVTAVENTVRAKSTKLSASDVAEIRASSESGLSLAARFGVTPSNISKIRHGVRLGPGRAGHHFSAGPRVPEGSVKSVRVVVAGRMTAREMRRRCRAALALVGKLGTDVGHRLAVAAR